MFSWLRKLLKREETVEVKAVEVEEVEVREVPDIRALATRKAEDLRKRGEEKIRERWLPTSQITRRKRHVREHIPAAEHDISRFFKRHGKQLPHYRRSVKAHKKVGTFIGDDED